MCHQHPVIHTEHIHKSVAAWFRDLLHDSRTFFSHLVGGWPPTVPLWKIRVSWDDEIPTNMEKWWHMFQTTNYLYLSCSWTLVLSPPRDGLPHVTTLPSGKIAAKAESVLQICRTFHSWCWTLELSPPRSGSPHAITLSPPRHYKANALHVAATFGCSATAIRLSPFWNPQSSRESARSRRHPSDAASLRKPCPKDRCAASFNSATVPSCETTTVSHRPLGRETWSLMNASATCSFRGLLSMAHAQLQSGVAEQILWSKHQCCVVCQKFLMSHGWKKTVSSLQLFRLKSEEEPKRGTGTESKWRYMISG